MSETICKGYLISRYDYQIFDEIISFINEYGNIFTLVALGTKKILSKNNRNLFYGCLTEFIFFASRDIDNKIGKLKKVTLLEDNIELSTRIPLVFLNQLISKNKTKGVQIFNEIKKIVYKLKIYPLTYDDLLIMQILINFTKYLGIKINLNGCSICNNKKVYTFDNEKHGFICLNHGKENYKINNEAIKLLHFLKEDKLNLCFDFDNLNKKICKRILVDYYQYHTGLNLYQFLFNQKSWI